MDERFGRISEWTSNSKKEIVLTIPIIINLSRFLTVLQLSGLKRTLFVMDTITCHPLIKNNS